MENGWGVRIYVSITRALTAREHGRGTLQLTATTAKVKYKSQLKLN